MPKTDSFSIEAIWALLLVFTVSAPPYRPAPRNSVTAQIRMQTSTVI